MTDETSTRLPSVSPSLSWNLVNRKLMTAYILAGQEAKALKAYERAHAWRELFTLAKNQPADVIAGMVERVTGKLTGSPHQLTRRLPRRTRTKH